MCIIIYTPDGNIPKKEIKLSLRNNPDGWGYIFLGNNRKIKVRKGLDINSFWLNWKKDKEARQGKNLLFHSRIKTSGKLNITNCHPFKIGRRNQWCMHNGIISEHTYTDSKKSDTIMFLKEIIELLPISWQSSEPLRKLVSGYIGFSKLAFMDGNGEVDIINDDLGEWDNKRWYSNDSYLPVVKTMGFDYKPYNHEAATTDSPANALLEPSHEEDMPLESDVPENLLGAVDYYHYMFPNIDTEVIKSMYEMGLSYDEIIEELEDMEKMEDIETAEEEKQSEEGMGTFVPARSRLVKGSKVA